MKDTDPQGSDPLDDLMDALGPDSADETLSNPDNGESEPEESQEAEASEESATEEVAEQIEFDGKKLDIPPGTPPALVESVKALANDLKADYTRKTQEVAEGRKAVEQRFEAIQQQEQLLSANFAKAVEYKALQDRLTQFEQLDWQALADSDPSQATKLNLAYQGLQRDAGKLYRELQQGEAQRQQMTAQQQRAMLEQGQKELQKRIPNWSSDVAKAITEHSQQYGFSAEELAKVSDPRLVLALHDAMKWAKLQADKPKAMQKVAAAPKVLKPGTTAPRNTNQAALDRLKKAGRIEDLAKFL